MTITVIQSVAVFDPESLLVVPDRTIVIEAGRIAAFGGAELAAPDGAKLIDGTGLTALPGLIDSHTHLCYDGKPSRFSDPTEPAGILAGLAMQAFDAHLRAGVTTVRDCGAPDGMVIQLRDAIGQGLIAGPRVLSAGRMLTMTGGHGSQIGRLVDGADSGTRAARAEIAEGADFIKLMATGGVVTKGVQPEQVALQPEEIGAIVRATHEAGRRVTAHATGLVGAKNAILGGVDSLEHGLNLDDEAVELAVAHGTMLVPTLSAVQRQRERAADLPEWMRVKVSAAVALHETSFRRALEAGVPIAAGTDAGTPFNPHGELAGEIQAMVGFGMEPAGALAAATRGSALNLGIADEAGSIRAGLSADILLVAGNPLDDLATLWKPVAVFARGQRVSLG